MKGKVDNMDKDMSNVSAYAVYKNLVPGVKSYQTSLSSIIKKKNKKKKPLTVSAPLSSAIKKTLNNFQKKDMTNNKSNQNHTVTSIATNGKNQHKFSNPPHGSNKGESSKPSNEKVVPDQSPNSNKNKKRNRKRKDGNSAEVNHELTEPQKKVQPVQPVKITQIPKPVEKKEELRTRTEEVNKKRIQLQKPRNEPKELTKQPYHPQPILFAKKNKAPERNILKGIKIIDQESISNLMSPRSFIIDSTAHGESLFKWLISPISLTKFFNDYWEKKPLLIKRDREPDCYKWIVTTESFDGLLRKNLVKFGKNIDVTSYTDGMRETLNPVGRAMPATLWDFYSNGCSIRMLNPQTYIDGLYKLNASLQEYLGTFVGANLYLTPPNSQGFAPHYDDIEAFILQVEGKKRWRLYAPRTPNEKLPTKSSKNFNEETDNLGKPILDVILEEGDLLYFPRGTIHQANALDVHSMHLTVSCYQQNTYGDLLKEYLPIAIEKAIEENVEFRKGLPKDYLSYMGVAQRRNKNRDVQEKRSEFEGNMKKMISKLSTDYFDHAADKLGKKFIHDSLPPALRREEKSVTSSGDGEFMSEGRVYNRCEFDPDIEVKLLRRHCVRLIFEEDSCRLYFNLENTLEYHEEDPQFVEIPFECGPAIEHIIQMYPEYVKVSDFPIGDELAKVQLAADLWERGILTTKRQLVPVRYDEDDIASMESDSPEEIDISQDDGQMSFDDEEDDDDDDEEDDDDEDEDSYDEDSDNDDGGNYQGSTDECEDDPRTSNFEIIDMGSDDDDDDDDNSD